MEDLAKDRFNVIDTAYLTRPVCRVSPGLNAMFDLGAQVCVW